MKCRTAILIAGLLMAMVSARAQDISTFASIPREQLFTRSFKSSSQTEKVIIRSYLVKKYPGTAEGLFSKAWLSGYEGHAEDSVRQYKECLAQYPDFLPALNNLASSLKEKENIEIYGRILEKDPSFFDYSAIQFTYFTYVGEMKDKSAGEKFLAEWERKLPGSYIFEFIRGVHAQNNEKDYTKAEQFYLKAIEKGTRNFAVYRALTDLRFNQLSDNKTDPKVRVGYLELIRHYLQQNPKSDEALIYLGDKFSDTFNAFEDAFGEYRKAFLINPSAEPAIKAFNSAKRISVNDAERFLLGANATLPNNPEILGKLGELYSNQLNDRQRAEDFHKQAIKYSYTTKDEIKNATALAVNVYQEITFEFDRAEQIYLSYLDKVPDKSSLLLHLFYNRRNAQDFSAALKYLNDNEKYLRARKTINETRFLDRHKELERYMSAEERAANYYKQNPFLRVWRGRFPDEAQQRLSFALNSVVVLPAEQQKLAQIADLMLEKGAEKYVFSIEGHGDRGETEVDGLSQRRAAAVVRLLHEVHGVPVSRMRAVGRGLGLAADNKETRYVEVYPLGNTANPSILTTGALRTDKTLAVSPDGKLLATGHSPLQVWDAQLQIKLFDLGRGGVVTKFSPDGRYLATRSNYTEVGGAISSALLVYDVRSGLVVSQVPWPNEIDELDWSPDSSRIVFTTADYNKIVIYDVAHKKLLRATISPGEAISGGDEVVWTRDGKYIVAGRAQHEGLTVYDPNTLAVVRSLEGVNWAHALGSTSDGRYLVCADNKSTLSVWDTRTFTLRQMPISVLAHVIVEHPTKPLIALSDFSGVEHNKIFLVDVTNMQVVAERDVGRDSSVGLGFSAHGDRLHVARKDRIETLDGATLEEVSSFTGAAFGPRGGAADQQNKYYLSYDEQSVHVWNVLTGRKAHTWNVGVEKLVRLAKESSRFVGLMADETAQKTYVKLFDTATFQQTELLTLDFKAESWTSNAQVIAFAGAPFMPSNSGSEQGVIEVYDRKSLALKFRTPILLQMAYLQYRTLNDAGIDSFDINDMGTEAIVTSYWQDGFGHAPIYAKEARVINLADGVVIHSFKIGSEVRQVRYDSNARDHVHVMTRGRTYVYNRRTGHYVSNVYNLRAYEYEIRLKGGQAHLRWGDDYLRYSDGKGGSKQIVFKEDLRSVEVFEDQNLLVTIGNSNEISFFDLSRLEKVLSIVSKKDNEWIAFTPSGEFASSINGTDKVYWSVGDQYLEFAALKSRFERPNILAERLEGIFRGEANTPQEAKAPSLDAELFVVPYSINVLSPRQTETKASNYKLQFNVVKSKSEISDPLLEYSHQGRQLDDQRRAGLAFGNSVIERDFVLVDGLNVIQVSINYKNATLATQTVLITRTPGPRPNVAVNDLWFLGVGVSEYKDTTLPLKFAHKDVEFVSALLKKQEGKLYRKVHSHLLLNEDATNQNIKAGMFEFLKKASDQDVVVIYLAGHGKQDSDQSLYFMTYESDFGPGKAYTGLDLLDIQKFLTKRPANQKAIVCMDICHAGSYGDSRANRGELTVEEAVKQLAEGTGLVVLASSTGRESSLESSEYSGGHGAFTAAMLEGLNGQADSDNDGYIGMGELQSYVSRRVPDITKGQQHPTVPLIQQLRDFPFVARLAAK